MGRRWGTFLLNLWTIHRFKKILLRKGFLSIQLLECTKWSRKIQIPDGECWSIYLCVAWEIYLLSFCQTLWNNAKYHMMYRVSLLTIIWSFFNLNIFHLMVWYRSITPYKKYHYICSLSHIFACQCSQEHIFFMCVYNVHGRVMELRLFRCLVLLSVDGEAGWRDGRASVTWPMCIRPRVYITYMCMNVFVYWWVCI